MNSSCFICLSDLGTEISQHRNCQESEQHHCDNITKQKRIVNVFRKSLNMRLGEELNRNVYQKCCNFIFCNICKTEMDQILNLQSLLDNFWNIIKVKIKKHRLKNIRLNENGIENAADVFRNQISKRLTVSHKNSAKKTEKTFNGAQKSTNEVYFINETTLAKNPYVNLQDRVTFPRETNSETKKNAAYLKNELETLTKNTKEEFQEEVEEEDPFIASPSSAKILVGIKKNSDFSYKYALGEENQVSEISKSQKQRKGHHKKQKRESNNMSNKKSKLLENIVKTSEGKIFFKNREIILGENGNSMKCSLCNYKIRNRSFYYMKVHILGKHLMAYNCKDCEKTFSTQRSLDVHRTGVHRWKNLYSEKYECKICSKPFKYRNTAQTHAMTHLNEEERKSRQISTKTAENKETNRQLRFTCEECGKSFEFNSLFQYHMETHININERQRHHLCSLCGKMFTSKPNLRNHTKFVHNKDKVQGSFCKMCGLKCNNPASLTVHMRSHTKEKPFKCPYCEKSFSTSGGLKAHIPQHTGERNYKCKQCDKSYSCSKHLRRHVQSVHLKIPMKTYKKSKIPIVSCDEPAAVILNHDSGGDNSFNKPISLVVDNHTDLMTFSILKADDS